MRKQIEYYCSDHCCACFDDDIVELKNKNAQLREAAEHFQHCRECAEDGLCWIGKQHDDFLSSLNDRKAV